MKRHLPRVRPKECKEFNTKLSASLIVPFLWIEHKMDWLAQLLDNWKLLEVLRNLGSFGVLIGVIFYFAESGNRLKQKHYQTWQVINSAQGKGGNGGRIAAVEELNADGVPLVGVDVSSAFLVGVQLPKANLARADFQGVDAREAVMIGAVIDDANLKDANFRGAKLKGSSLQNSVLNDADFYGASMEEVDLNGAMLENADLGDAELNGLKWENIKSIKGANVTGVKNPPNGFMEWALKNGAIKNM